MFSCYIAGAKLRGNVFLPAFPPCFFAIGASGTGHPSISIGLPVIKTIRKCTERMFDVHLMIDEPVRYIDDFATAGADIITVHAEACKHLDRTIEAIKEKGILAGVALIRLLRSQP